MIKWKGKLSLGKISPKHTQVDLGDMVGSVPDHCNKADMAIKQVK